MCFRPAGAEQSIECPECGKKITAVMGNISPICPFCEADIRSFVEQATNKKTPPIPSPQAPGSPSTSGAPKPPSAPSAS